MEIIKVIIISIKTLIIFKYKGHNVLYFTCNTGICDCGNSAALNSNG